MKLFRKLKSSLILVTLLAGMAWTSGLCAALEEYEVKAAFIYNFAKFIDWPAHSFPTPDAPVIVGIVGADPFGASLEQTFQGQTVRGRPLITKRLKELSCPDCHILFVASSEARRISEILDANRGKHIVTISDIPQFNSKGGVIHLFVEKNKVRFAINTQAAERAGVKISSQLLKLSHSAGGP